MALLLDPLPHLNASHGIVSCELVNAKNSNAPIKLWINLQKLCVVFLCVMTTLRPYIDIYLQYMVVLFFCRYKTLEYWLDLVCRLCCGLGGRVFRSGGPIEDSSLLFCTLSARMAKVEVEEAVGG
ncbi:hypothetical protein ACOTEH_09885 [Achromobacter xylosoxidans]